MGISSITWGKSALCLGILNKDTRNSIVACGHSLFSLSFFSVGQSNFWHRKSKQQENIWSGLSKVNICIRNFERDKNFLITKESWIMVQGREHEICPVIQLLSDQRVDTWAAKRHKRKHMQTNIKSPCPLHLLPVCTKESHSLNHVEVNHTSRSCIYTMGFCTGKFQHGRQNSWSTRIGTMCQQSQCEGFRTKN